MDRIYEAYMGGMGESFAEKTQKRIHWICSKVQGNRVLDVGCSQGITAILLARNGLKVTGLDISEETIARAREYLAEEPEEVQNNVVFAQGDFGCHYSDACYDTVIMGEVLEHLLHPEVFVANAAKLLKNNGRLIITVPFGINDDPDHKQTFYYFAMTHLLERYFQISETVFFGKWIGFVAEKKQVAEVRESYGFEECLQVEQAFYQIERGNLNTIADGVLARKQLNEQIAHYKSVDKELREKLTKTQQDYATCKEWLQNKNLQLERAVEAKSAAEAKITVLTEDKSAAEAKIAEITALMTAAEEEMAAAENTLLEQQQMLADANDKFAKLSEEKSLKEEALKLEIQTVLQEKARLLDSYAQLQKKFNKSEDNYQTCKLWLANANRKVDLLTAENKELKAQIEILRQTMKQTDAVLAAEEKFLIEAKKKYNAMNTELRQTKWKAKRYDIIKDKLHNTWYGKLAMVPLKVLRKIKKLFHK